LSSIATVHGDDLDATGQQIQQRELNLLCVAFERKCYMWVDQIDDDLGLLAVDPASAGGEEELKREEVGHGALYRPAGHGAVSRGCVTYG